MIQRPDIRYFTYKNCNVGEVAIAILVVGVPAIEVSIVFNISLAIFAFPFVKIVI